MFLLGSVHGAVLSDRNRTPILNLDLATVYICLFVCLSCSFTALSWISSMKKREGQGMQIV